MNMWDQIKGKDDMHHLYLQEELGGPQTLAPQTKNTKSPSKLKHSTTPNKVILGVKPRRSSKLQNNDF